MSLVVYFTRGFATSENTAFGVYAVKIKIDLTLKKSNILYTLYLKRYIIIMVVSNVWSKMRSRCLWYMQT